MKASSSSPAIGRADSFEIPSSDVASGIVLGSRVDMSKSFFASGEENLWGSPGQITRSYRFETDMVGLNIEPDDWCTSVGGGSMCLGGAIGGARF